MLLGARGWLGHWLNDLFGYSIVFRFEGAVLAAAVVALPMLYMPAKAAFATVEEAHGPVEVLVANAGITADTLVLRMSEDDWSSVIDTNLTGSFRLAKRAAKGMLRLRRGRATRVSIESNREWCQGLLATRYGGTPGDERATDR